MAIVVYALLPCESVTLTDTSIFAVAGVTAPLIVTDAPGT